MVNDPTGGGATNNGLFVGTAKWIFGIESKVATC
jgi:hypothetical protein